MKCDACQSDNREGVKFCEECGRSIAVECPACNARIPKGKKFCGECGQKLGPDKAAMSGTGIDYTRPDSYTPKFMAEKILTTRGSIEGERKLVTVFFCDVTGFTSLSEQLDPEAVHQIMDGCFKILMEEIHRFEGTINQFTGDGVMALFGAPIAHEDHAQRACKAALSIQARLRGYGKKVRAEFGPDFKMRIGLNSGPVVVGAIGDDLRMDYTAVGDTTNLAARMESMADPGSVLLSESTHRQVRRYFDCENLGTVTVKGKKEPQTIFRLIGKSGIHSRLDASQARGFIDYIGREQETADLVNAFDRVRRGSGRVVGIVGEAGIGKSRFVFEMHRQMGRQARLVETRCLQYKSNIPFFPLIKMITSLFDIGKGESEKAVHDKLTKGLKAIDPELLTQVPALRHFLSLPPGDTRWEALDPREKRESIFEALRNLFIRMSRNLPLVLVVDDIQWLDNTSEEFLNYFTGWISNAKVLLLLLYRQEYSHSWGGKPYYSQIAIPPLSGAESRQFIRALLGAGEISDRLESLIYNRTSGNPLFMEELSTTLIEDRTIVKEAGQWRLKDTGDLVHVPETIQGIIAGRMDRLEDNTKTTMQMASVIGRSFGFHLLQRLTGMDDAIKDYLLTLRNLEFINEKTLFPELEYIFKNMITREVAYNSLLLNHRRVIHGNIGLAIEEMYGEQPEAFYEILAFHFSKSGRHGKAVHYLKASGDKAMQNHSAFEAFEFYKRAAALLEKEGKEAAVENSPEQAGLDLLHAMISPMIILNFPPGCMEFLEKGTALSKQLNDGKSLIRFYSNTGYLHSVRGNHKLGIQFAGKAYEQAVESDDITAMAQTSPDLCLAHHVAGNYPKVIEIASHMIHTIRKAGRETDNFGGPAVVYPAFYAMSGYSMALLGKFDQGLTNCSYGLEEVKGTKNLFTKSLCRFYTGMTLLLRGDWDKARSGLDNLLRDLSQVSFTQIEAIAKGGLGVALAYTGEPEKGIRLAREALAMFEAEDIKWQVSNLQFYIGTCLHKSGDSETALEWMDKAKTTAEQNDEIYFQAKANLWSGRLLGKCSTSFSKAEQRMTESLDTLTALKAKPDIATAHMFLGELYAGSGQTAKSGAELVRAEGLFAGMGMDYWRRQAAELISEQ
ncbi:MAG: AAA family ATPase [Desulfobacterales bacterium]|nr:AAA family ATPase [Desulfobacterales bacterium]